MRNLKLIWDFKGPDHHKTAQHHLIHLKEWGKMENIDFLGEGTELISDRHSIAFAAVKEENMPKMRDQLKPHRGQLWTQTP